MSDSPLCFTSPHCECDDCTESCYYSQMTHDQSCKCCYCFDAQCECYQCDIIRKSSCICTCESCVDDKKWENKYD